MSGMRSPTPEEWAKAWAEAGDVPEVAGERLSVRWCGGCGGTGRVGVNRDPRHGFTCQRCGGRGIVQEPR